MRVFCFLLGVGLIAWAAFRLVTDAPIGVNESPSRNDVLQLIFFVLQVGLGALLVYIAVFDPPDFSAADSADQEESGFGADLDFDIDLD
ncbi:hypothetical protein ACGFNU_33380 [Spirillospora sp. NPDC048911]|uniref:hypothetical protein n=1 Tax=Spirillospora sp. NPDC048911 TaxID=3364527 RepID=UPI00371F698B